MRNRYNNQKPSHFEENFSESSANISQSNYGGESPYPNDNSPTHQGSAIQLLQIKPNGNIQLNDEALDIIASYNDKPVSFVALVGKYRTGKSFLLNKLLYLQKNGFKVDQSTRACTQGIWMWSDPFENDLLQNYLFFIDTEGLASLQKNESNDIKIFTLATLISSYFIYNSQGCIDQRSISDLNAITKLSKNIMTEERLSPEQNQRKLKDFMPSFCWVIRDFTLQLKDQRGRNITPQQYLQNCLREDSPYSRNGDSNKIKKSLLSLFKNRDCVTLVRPARQQNEIQTLDKLSDVYLRREFIDGLGLLRNKINQNAKCKMYEGKPLYGNDMACMIEAYAQAINDGKIPSIKSAWEQIVDNEGDLAFSAAHQKYLQLFEQYFGDEEPKQEKQMNRLLPRMKQEAIDEFKRNCSSQSQEHSRKLRDWINTQQDNIRQANQNAMNSRNLEILKDQSHGLMKKVQENYYVGKKEQYFADLDNVLKNYRRKAVGDKKEGLLVDFMAATSKIGVNLEKKPQNYEDNEHLARETQQKITKLQEQANKSKSNQKTTTANMAKKQEDKKQKKDKNKNSKVQKAGCCGGKCEIM